MKLELIGPIALVLAIPCLFSAWKQDRKERKQIEDYETYWRKKWDREEE